MTDDSGQNQNPESDPVARYEEERSDSSLLTDMTGAGRVDWRNNILIPLLAILSALIVGAIIIAFSDVDTLRLWGSDPGEALSVTVTTIKDAYVALFEGAFGGIGPISETLTRAAPLILAGLAVAIGFQAGLFNIGANGQALIGGMFALVVGFQFSLPAFIHIPLIIIAVVKKCQQGFGR